MKEHKCINNCGLANANKDCITAGYLKGCPLSPNERAIRYTNRMYYLSSNCAIPYNPKLMICKECEPLRKSFCKKFKKPIKKSSKNMVLDIYE